MITMQQNIMNAIEKIATANKLKVVTQFTYANTGKLFFQYGDSFAWVLTLSVNFQDSYFCVDGGLKAYIEYKQPEKIDLFLSQLKTALSSPLRRTSKKAAR